MIQIYTIQIYIWSKKIYGHAECDKIHLHTKTKNRKEKTKSLQQGQFLKSLYWGGGDSCGEQQHRYTVQPKNNARARTDLFMSTSWQLAPSFGSLVLGSCKTQELLSSKIKLRELLCSIILAREDPYMYQGSTHHFWSAWTAIYMFYKVYIYISIKT